MKFTNNLHNIHFTYCLNIHSGETWPDTLAEIKRHVEKVKQKTAPNKPFGIGLRLSAKAAVQLEKAHNLINFRQYLKDSGIYVFTINGFPYGDFHKGRIKTDVYCPDWATDKRLEYTKRLARILCALMPENITGSISTVPGSYREWVNTQQKYERIVSNLIRMALYCQRAEEDTGKRVRIALEPEPDCLWENVADIKRLFKEDLPEIIRETLKYSGGEVSEETLYSVVKKYFGICYDTCHQSVLFEDPVADIQELQQNNIEIPKIQLSSALKCKTDQKSLQDLQDFAENTYLHQTVIKNGSDKITRYPDLAPAIKSLTENPDSTKELRTHFHVPLHQTQYSSLKSTRDDLTEEFFTLLREGASQHIEVETYSFSSIPEQHRQTDVTSSIVEEMKWGIGSLQP